MVQQLSHTDANNPELHCEQNAYMRRFASVGNLFRECASLMSEFSNLSLVQLLFERSNPCWPPYLVRHTIQMYVAFRTRDQLEVGVASTLCLGCRNGPWYSTAPTPSVDDKRGVKGKACRTTTVLSRVLRNHHCCYNSSSMAAALSCAKEAAAREASSPVNNNNDERGILSSIDDALGFFEEFRFACTGRSRATTTLNTNDAMLSHMQVIDVSWRSRPIVPPLPRSKKCSCVKTPTCSFVTPGKGFDFRLLDERYSRTCDVRHPLLVLVNETGLRTPPPPHPPPR